jgi:hypothetical protein
MCDCIFDELRNNLDTMVILHTESGCFQGLCVEVDENCCKLISCGNASRCGFGRVTICRLSDVEAVTFCCACR